MKKTDVFLRDQKISIAHNIAKIRKQQRLGLYPTSLSMPIGIQFELTSQCNLSCKHCYNKSSMSTASQMKPENWIDVAYDINANGGIFQCILSGGEPLLLGEKLLDIMSPLSENGTAFVLITNGFFVDEQWVSALKQFKYYWVQVSIDHLHKDAHDAFRGKKGSWDRAVNAALLLSSAGLPLRIAHSLTPQSLNYLHEFADFCYQLGASSLICGEIMLSGRAAENRDVLMAEDDYEKMYALISVLQKQYQRKMAVLCSSSEVLEMRHRQKILNSSVIIRPNGDIRLDCTMPFTIGNVLETSLSAAWSSKGNTCWQDPNVHAFIKNIEEFGNDSPHINHVSPDIAL